ncbi:16S rRNA (cytosine(967)-C(5))-methyltransferase RsmB [Desulfoscipio gibsoniae]|uniref:16S rRNA (cytosine(967)-C(5))-methyltransferase n=1 Tax=Desulfoscipio gibsoniae DSM 7213 TaxID=767817 RepID=R4KRK5_9FIRM|nr:16S rRNA (cytosine(967)-C(5))-methyltransferase RsmB [Desulfoscipio gibsoniae]AGL02241.1 ribosomal RNA small subunit methyltransferase RsmB [Desulfoscipio gibsoniae DSM 7213]
MTQKISARETALKVLLAVEEREAYANLALGAVLDKMNPGKLDRAFITELVYGTLRTQNTLDWALSRYLRRSLPELTAAVRNILRLGTYQILFMDRVPDSAAVNESAILARRHGHEGIVKFVNGVLRNLVRGKKQLNYPDPNEDPVQYIALRHSHPAWLVRRWLNDFGFAETEALCAANNQPAPNTVRVNTLKTSAAELIEKLATLGVKATRGQYAVDCLQLQGFVSLGGLAPFKEGLLQAQDESSILVGQAVRPAPGSRVLDVASAPGGKATHLAQLMQNQGVIMALDVHEHKIKLIEENCRRLGVQIVQPVLADARQIPEKYTGWADYVLVDAPCSGLGVLRRRPDARWRKGEEQLAALAELQAQILESAAAVLKPGGVLVYSTCTITCEENLGQVKSFLHKHADFQWESLAELLPDSLDYTATMGRGYLQLLPHIHGLDGFFIARLRKSDNMPLTSQQDLYGRV